VILHRYEDEKGYRFRVSVGSVADHRPPSGRGGQRKIVDGPSQIYSNIWFIRNFVATSPGTSPQGEEGVLARYILFLAFREGVWLYLSISAGTPRVSAL